MNQRVKDVMKFAFFLGLGLFLVWWSWSSFSEEDRIKVWQSFKEANYYWVGFSLVAALLSHVSRAMRWQMFLQPIAHKPTFGNAFCAVMINYLANLAFPRLGEITRCGVINQYEKIPVDKAFGTVITERIIDVVTLVILTAIVVLTQFETIGTYFLENIAAPMQEKYGHLLSGDNLILFAIVGFGLLVLAGVAWFLLRNFRETALYQKIMGVVKGIYEGVMSVR
ncbi:MAG: lysylphosphatidylglycerol synthase transmembrane domain-containing protein, partial [Chitinophagales bacterium]